ncbi:hypothetical protein BRW65_23715, partial [Mycobacterium paraffinicum]
VEAIRTEGGTAIGVTADVADDGQLTDAVREIAAQHGAPLIVLKTMGLAAAAVDHVRDALTGRAEDNPPDPQVK